MEISHSIDHWKPFSLVHGPCFGKYFESSTCSFLHIALNIYQFYEPALIGTFYFSSFARHWMNLKKVVSWNDWLAQVREMNGSSQMIVLDI